MPKISIITVTYKHKEFIGHTIESILSQTFSDWEMLIGDDSPDNETWDVIQQYVVKYPHKIKAWHHIPNKGIVANMNFLISHASKESEYIALLEGDDMYMPNNLEEKLKVFNTYKNLALIYNNIDFIDANGKVFQKNFLKKAPFYLKNQKITRDQFIKYDDLYSSYSSFLIKKDVLNKEKIINPTKDPLYSVSDVDLFFRIFTKYNVYGIEDSLTLYRRHSNNITTIGNHQESKILKDLLVLLSYYKKNNKITEKEYKHRMGKLSHSKACKYIETGSKGLAIKSFLRSIFLFPLYNIKGKISLFFRIIIPYKLQIYLLKIFYYSKWES